jgi:cytochrome c oxidase assembly protein subunit 15
LAALGAVILQGLLGGLTVLFLLPKPVSIGHACLAQLFFSTTVAIALFTSPSWRGGAEALPETGFARSLALACPLTVLAQLALGAAYRHQAVGLIPHVAGAMAVAAVVLSTGVVVLLQYGRSQALRRGAVALMLVTFVQVFLGVAAYMSLVAAADSARPEPLMVWFTVAHVAVGALTMAASVALAIQVFRNIRRVEPALSPGGVTATS